TLTDKLAKSMPGSSEADRKRAARLAQTIVFTSQGTPFMFAGEEVFRDKKGVHNSYKSPDSVNAIDWRLKHVNADQFDYYRELVALRKAHPAFRMTKADDVARHLRFEKTDGGNLVAYRLLDNANGDEWKEIYLAFNGNDSSRSVKLPKGEWMVVAYDGKINHKGLDSAFGLDGVVSAPGEPVVIKGGRSIEVPAASAFIAARLK
nr:type I pullulanase [Muribaculaceae bacterium]